VGSTFSSFQQPGGCQQKSAQAKGGHFSPSAVLLNDPGNKILIAFNSLAQFSIKCRNNDQVCFLYFTDQCIRIHSKKSATQKGLPR
jgi:hypothetical protein